MKITIYNINTELERLVKIGVPTKKAIAWFRQQLTIIICDESVHANDRQAAEIALKIFDESSSKPNSDNN